MKNLELSPSYSLAGEEARQARIAFRAAAYLTEQAAELPQDLSERLRFAREQALERARAARKVQTAMATSVLTQGSVATLGAPGGEAAGWWVRLGSVLPLIALVLGLLLIQHWHSSSQIEAAAEIDASLLADDLPPAAYSDPGFVEFLKVPRD